MNKGILFTKEDCEKCDKMKKILKGRYQDSIEIKEATKENIEPYIPMLKDTKTLQLPLFIILNEAKVLGYACGSNSMLEVAKEYL